MNSHQTVRPRTERMMVASTIWLNTFGNGTILLASLRQDDRFGEQDSSEDDVLLVTSILCDYLPRRLEQLKHEMLYKLCFIFLLIGSVTLKGAFRSSSMFQIFALAQIFKISRCVR